MRVEDQEKLLWNRIEEPMQGEQFHFGDHWSFNFRNDPKRFGFVLSRYKAAADMCPKNARILELGCSEGIGAPILCEQAIDFTGVDLDESAICVARKNLEDKRFKFIYDDFMGKVYGKFDAVISLDVIEHILPEFKDLYLKTILMNLSLKGICVIGTPNITAAPHASLASQIGHVNLYSQERLVRELQRYFHQVLPFGMNDEVLHTGYAPMSHYLFCVACLRKEI